MICWKLVIWYWIISPLIEEGTFCCVFFWGFCGRGLKKKHAQKVTIGDLPGSGIKINVTHWESPGIPRYLRFLSTENPDISIDCVGSYHLTSQVIKISWYLPGSKWPRCLPLFFCIAISPSSTVACKTLQLCSGREGFVVSRLRKSLQGQVESQQGEKWWWENLTLKFQACCWYDLCIM